MERSATHDTEYVDIVLGYRHILLFSLVFGAVIFGTGYFTGYHRGQSVEAARANVTAPGQTPAQASPPAPLPPVQVPAMLTQPESPETGDVLKEVEELSQESLAPGTKTETPEPKAPASSTAPPPPAQEPETPAEEPRAEEKPAPAALADEPAATPQPQASSKKPTNRPGVYLQVSSFGSEQDAEELIDDLAAEGYRALIDGQLIGGKHTVLVGPFEDFKAAVGQAKELKRQNRQVFPIRR